MELVWDAPPRALLIERKIRRSPLAAARKLADLDRLLEKNPALDYERIQRDDFLEAFNRLQRCSHCGRPISKDASIEAGMGSICRRNVAEAERRRREQG